MSDRYVFSLIYNLLHVLQASSNRGGIFFDCVLSAVCVLSIYPKNTTAFKEYLHNSS